MQVYKPFDSFLHGMTTVTLSFNICVDLIFVIIKNNK